MRWKLKAGIQNVIARLPTSASYAAYYWVQRNFGELKRSNPVSRLRAGVVLWRRALDLGHDPVGKTFFEVGTGRTPVMPLAFWLMGADKVITIDLNPYLKGELIAEDLAYMADHQDEIREIFGPLLHSDRLRDLIAFYRNTPFSTRAILDFCRIQYIAPGDAAKTGLPDGSVDFHVSFTVFEHIPPNILRDIMREGNRITTKGGLFIHSIDYSDHFWHSDKTISAINFLQFSDAKWEKYAGNRYMYMNRLRHDDFLDLLKSVDHRILRVEPNEDRDSYDLLVAGKLKLDSRFQGKSEKILSTIDAVVASQRAGDTPPA